LLNHHEITRLVAFVRWFSLYPGPGITARHGDPRVIDEYENSVRANTLKIINAPTEEEKNKYRARHPQRRALRDQADADHARPTLDKPEVVPAVCWLVTGAASFPEGQEAKKMLATTYAGSQGIAER
jgi:hypothetical protein